MISNRSQWFSAGCTCTIYLSLITALRFAALKFAGEILCFAQAYNTRILWQQNEGL
jgi:hypothetical protein